VRGDIPDDESLKRGSLRRETDYVFHLAAHFANQNPVNNPETDLMKNGMGILTLLRNTIWGA